MVIKHNNLLGSFKNILQGLIHRVGVDLIVPIVFLTEAWNAKITDLKQKVENLFNEKCGKFIDSLSPRCLPNEHSDVQQIHSRTSCQAPTLLACCRQSLT